MVGVGSHRPARIADRDRQRNNAGRILDAGTGFVRMLSCGRLTRIDIDNHDDTGTGAQSHPAAVHRALGIDDGHQEKAEPTDNLQYEAIVESAACECHREWA